jgi:hypothetical protein
MPAGPMHTVLVESFANWQMYALLRQSVAWRHVRMHPGAPFPSASFTHTDPWGHVALFPNVHARLQ